MLTPLLEHILEENLKGRGYLERVGVDVKDNINRD